MRVFCWFLPVGGVAGCADSACPLPSRFEDPAQPNVLVVVIDDVGIDQYAPWEVTSEPVSAPTMDCLCRAGLRFDTVWASPFCTPARAALLTGMHPRRDGIGRFIDVNSAGWELPLSRRTLAEALAEEGYATAFYGKWHLASKDSQSGARHPNRQGFEHFAGTMGNLKPPPTGDSERGDYFDWEHLEDGVLSARSGYVTSATIDDALAGLSEMPEPWFVVVSFNGAHTPLHRPPRRLIEGRLARDAEEAEQHRAMVESVDAELGRLLSDLDRAMLGRTQVWTLSDNGTIADGRPEDEPANRSKGTLYEGGVRIPLVASGAGVPRWGQSSDALVSILDVFPTIVEHVGGEVGEIDGRSLRPVFEDPQAPHRDVLYADVTSQDDEIHRAVRSRELKLVRFEDGTTKWWRMLGGLDEEPLSFGNRALRDALDGFVAEYDPLSEER